MATEKTAKRMFIWNFKLQVNDTIRTDFTIKMKKSTDGNSAVTVNSGSEFVSDETMSSEEEQTIGEDMARLLANVLSNEVRQLVSVLQWQTNKTHNVISKYS